MKHLRGRFFIFLCYFADLSFVSLLFYFIFPFVFDTTYPTEAFSPTHDCGEQRNMYLDIEGGAALGGL